MSSEIDISYFFPELSEFIHNTYGLADQSLVDSLIDESKKSADEHNKQKDKLWNVDPLTSLRNITHYLAQSAGISKELLIALTAVQKLEDALPAEERELTPKAYLEILVMGELTTAHNSSDSWTGFEPEEFKEIELHTQRASKLLEFLKNFE